MLSKTHPLIILYHFISFSMHVHSHLFITIVDCIVLLCYLKSRVEKDGRVERNNNILLRTSVNTYLDLTYLREGIRKKSNEQKKNYLFKFRSRAIVFVVDALYSNSMAIIHPHFECFLIFCEVNWHVLSWHHVIKSNLCHPSFTEQFSFIILLCYIIL